jgi:hypothetical protein
MGRGLLGLEGFFFGKYDYQGKERVQGQKSRYRVFSVGKGYGDIWRGKAAERIGGGY